MKNIRDIIMDYEVKSFFYKETLELNIKGDQRGKFLKGDEYTLSIDGDQKIMRYMSCQYRPIINMTTVKFVQYKK